MTTPSTPRPSSTRGAVIGDGTRIWHWVHVCAGARIGARCSFGQNVFVGNVVIGDNVKVQNNVSIYDAVTIEDDVFCGPSMVFTNVINPRSTWSASMNTVRRWSPGATIGANATVICGHTIGRYAMVGAGAVVTRMYPTTPWCRHPGPPRGLDVPVRRASAGIRRGVLRRLR